MIAPIVVGIDDAQELVGLGRTKVYELVNAGRIRSFKVDGRRLFSVADLHAWVNDELEAQTGERAVPA